MNRQKIFRAVIMMLILPVGCVLGAGVIYLGEYAVWATIVAGVGFLGWVGYNSP